MQTAFDAWELIRHWKRRRRKILESLSPELRKEYLELGISLKRAYLGISGASGDKAMAIAKAILDPAPKVSLDDRKKQLLDYLRQKGPAHRGEIISDTGIPPGTLANLLQQSEFENVSRGVWKAK
jgi:hypothetical protein